MLSVFRAVCDLQIITIPLLFCFSRCFQRGNKAVEGRTKTVQDVTLKAKKKKEKKRRKKKGFQISFLRQPCVITVFISLYLNTEQFQLIKNDTCRAQNNRAAKGSWTETKPTAAQWVDWKHTKRPRGWSAWQLVWQRPQKHVPPGNGQPHHLLKERAYLLCHPGSAAWWLWKV